MKIVIRLGGSVLASPPNPKLFTEYAEKIKNLKSQGHTLAVIVGGGQPAREFIQIARELELSEEEQDQVAISTSRIIAQLFLMKIGNPKNRITTTLEEAYESLEQENIVVMGGVKPGWTTDTVAATIASKIHADLIIKATNQKGIYTEDPEKNPKAKKLDEINYSQLGEILEEEKHKVGIHQIIDPKAFKILKKSRIKTIVLNGFKPENILLAIQGEKIGTIIT